MTIDDALSVAGMLIRSLTDTGANRMDAQGVTVYRGATTIRIDIDARRLERPEGDA